MQDHDLISLVALREKDVASGKMPPLGLTLKVCRFCGTQRSQEAPRG
jgi:hypothetical protein